jgi:hypothetical protein
VPLLALRHTWHPYQPKQTAHTYLLEWLHLMALGDRCGYRVLVTLGGCHHLDGLEQQRSIDMSWWLFMAISRWLWGVLCLSRQGKKVTLVDSSYHWATLVVARFFQCLSEDKVYATPLSCRTTKCWSTQRGLACWSTSTWTSGEKSSVFIVIVSWISPSDWFLYYCVWFTCLYTSI